MTMRKTSAVPASLLALLALLSVQASCRKAESPTLPGLPGPTPTGCPVASLPVAVNAAGVTFNGNTSGASSDFGGASCQTGTNAPDDLYRFTLTSPARIQVLKSSAWASRFYIRQGGCEGAEVACMTSNGIHEFNLSAGDYYLIVDGDLSTDSGAYQLALRDVTP